MAKLKEPKPFTVHAKAWATKRRLFGPQAFLKYVMLTYLEALNQVSRDILFKGGNLLWIYIGTPRSTTDLDLATLTINTHDEVKTILEDACGIAEGIQFKIQSFKPVSQEKKEGAAVTIGYQTAEGAKNSFDIDIVYALPTDFSEIPSPIQSEILIYAATLENIITDKLAALQRFGAGNTRIKDLDDLWRLAERRIEVRQTHLAKLLKTRVVLPSLDMKWINPNMEKAWSNHQKRYPDLPETLRKVFTDVNKWLQSLQK